MFRLVLVLDRIHGKVSLVLLADAVVLGAEQTLLPQEVRIQQPEPNNGHEKRQYQ